MNWHHRPVKNFYLEGEIYDESHIARLKAEYLALLTFDMRMKGYVPRVDINPDFTVDYRPGKGFKFKITLYGSFIGKKKSQEIQGLDGYRPIYMVQQKVEEPIKEV